MTTDPIYVRISEGEPFPDISSYGPFRAVVVLDGAYSPEWQDEASDWLVRSGCLYMMAWGENCSSWDDSVDFANIRKFDFQEIPDESFVMTTWHDNEPLEEVFWFAGFCAHQGDVELDSTLIVHVGRADRSTEMRERFQAAQSLYD